MDLAAGTFAVGFAIASLPLIGLAAAAGALPRLQMKMQQLFFQIHSNIGFNFAHRSFRLRNAHAFNHWTRGAKLGRDITCHVFSLISIFS